MSFRNDELAGVVDLFGALTRAELERALAELAFKAGEDVDERAVDDAVASAVESYHLVAVDRGDETLLAPGPVAFPTLPADAEDLPHILDVEPREIDRASVATDVETRLRADAARAVDDGDHDRIERLLDVTYDLETWAPVDVSEVRTRLDDALDD
ncbi:hypothetical protein ACFQJD_03815 [Haloplanus sp. GCM10025708]|uniref:DUF7109 family protein n=1 Tax=Haloferacaceae TaxID=1644056 RepID=UPI0036140A8A